MNIGAELGVLNTVYFHNVRRGLVHAVVFIRQFIPCRLQSLAMAAPGHNRCGQTDRNFISQVRKVICPEDQLIVLQLRNILVVQYVYSDPVKCFNVSITLHDYIRDLVAVDNS